MKKGLLILLAISLLCFGALVVFQPYLIKAIYAKYKSTEHFVALKHDSRVRYEPGAEANARKLAQVLDDVALEVEEALGAKFDRNIEAYICATQEQFNEYVYLSKNARGAVYWEKLFLSPGAFQGSYLRPITLHELTHYLFITHLSDKQHIQNIPLWFREGIAVYVANGNSEYMTRSRYIRLMTNAEKSDFWAGKYDAWFSTADPSSVLAASGAINFELYRIYGYLVHYLAMQDEGKFKSFIGNLLDGQEFYSALNEMYGKDLAELLTDFSIYLKNT